MVSKEVEQREEVVRDTVRKTEVEVDESGRRTTTDDPTTRRS